MVRRSFYQMVEKEQKWSDLLEECGMHRLEVLAREMEDTQH